MYIGQRRRKKGRPLVVMMLLGLVLYLGLAMFWAGPSPELEITSDLPGIGPATSVHALVNEPRRGVGSVRLVLVQNGTTHLLAEESHTPRPFWKIWGHHEPSVVLKSVVGSGSHAGIKQGPALLRLSATRSPAWLRRPGPAVKELTLEVDLKAPGIELIRRPAGVRQGGSAVVVYSRDDDSVSDGVRIGDSWFPGSDVPDQPGRRFTLFVAPLDLESEENILLVARDALGNEFSTPFVDDLGTRRVRRDSIRLSDGFFQKVVSEIRQRVDDLELPEDDLLQSYLIINRELRKANAETLRLLAAKTVDEFLWNRSFERLPGSKLMASFGDRRAYLYDGQEVDRQTHLGIDLASVKRSPVPAAADGVVAMAGYLGIYGNTVVVDHGFGLMSVYAHLTAAAVAVGDRVKRGEEIGRTGETGLAGGDHLHFSVLVHGQQADPNEWFDSRWIANHIEVPLEGGFVLSQ